MNNLIWIAIVLIVLWVVASVTKFIVGAAIHLLLVVGIILLVVGAARRIF